MDVDRVAAADLIAQLADGLEERQTLDVAHRAADLHDDDVHVQPLELAYGGLDGIRDVRDDLHGAAEIVAAALLLDDRVVDAPCGDVVVLRHRLSGEALVVPQIEIGFRAVVRHIHFAVLVGAHGARVHIDVRIKLLERHPQAAGLQQQPDGGAGDALAETRHDPAGHKNVFLGHRILTCTVYRLPCTETVYDSARYTVHGTRYTNPKRFVRVTFQRAANPRGYPPRWCRTGFQAT